MQDRLSRLNILSAPCLAFAVTYQVVAVPDWHAVEADDHITGLDAASLRWRASLDGSHNRAFVFR